MERRNVISFINMKGGVCKTTLCKEIALYISENDKKVLVIDIDPQANCTQSFFERYKIFDPNEEELLESSNDMPSIEYIFSPKKKILEKPTLKDVILELTNNLHIVPGELHTIFMERETGTGASEQKLLNYIDDHSLRNKYDYIFIDCPPTYSFYTTAALLSSDLYLVPLIPDAYSLLGFNLLTEVINNIKGTYKSNFKIKPLDMLGIIFTRIPKNKTPITMTRNINGICEAVDSTVPIFENYFYNSNKIVTSKLSKFIYDRSDEDLLANLKLISEEFVKKVEKVNGNDKNCEGNVK